jgi:hypothetical protein
MRATAGIMVGALLALALLAPGCLGPAESPVHVVPYVPLNDAAPGRGTEFAFFLESTSPFKETWPVRAADVPDGWTFESESPDVTIAGDASSSLIVRITPDANASFGPHTIGVLVGDTRANVIVNVAKLGDVPLRAGVGTQLLYVLWYANGTLIETNEKTVSDQKGLKWSRLGNESPDYTPLKVYVGGKRGTPPPEPYNSTGCDKPPCYHPVIAGFDRRLQDAGDGSGMVQGETLAVRVPKELAYTIPGKEDHPLYGQDLTFLIRIVSVDVLTARTCSLPVCPPTG